MASGKIFVMDCPHCGDAICKSDGRGGPIITREKIEAVYKKRGGPTTQTVVAQALGVSVRSVRDWCRRNRLPWEQLKQGVEKR